MRSRPRGRFLGSTTLYASKKQLSWRKKFIGNVKQIFLTILKQKIQNIMKKLTAHQRTRQSKKRRGVQPVELFDLLWKVWTKYPALPWVSSRLSHGRRKRNDNRKNYVTVIVYNATKSCEKIHETKMKQKSKAGDVTQSQKKLNLYLSTTISENA